MNLKDIDLEKYTPQEIAEFLFKLGRNLQEKSMNFTGMPGSILVQLSMASNHVTVAATKLEKI